MVDTDVLIVGAGPVGLTAAAELRRQGTTCRIIDKLPARLPYAEAVGVQPRTLEVWDRMGMVRAALEAAVPMRGQLMYADGVEQARFELRLPPGPRTPSRPCPSTRRSGSSRSTSPASAPGSSGAPSCWGSRGTRTGS